jgi:hypothetical protein
MLLPHHDAWPPLFMLMLLDRLHNACPPPPAQVQWLTETDLMPLLLDRLRPGYPPDAQRHAAEVLAAVARSALSPLVARMAAPEFLNTLLSHAFSAASASASRTQARRNAGG